MYIPEDVETAFTDGLYEIINHLKIDLSQKCFWLFCFTGLLSTGLCAGSFFSSGTKNRSLIITYILIAYYIIAVAAYTVLNAQKFILGYCKPKNSNERYYILRYFDTDTLMYKIVVTPMADSLITILYKLTIYSSREKIKKIISSFSFFDFTASIPRENKDLVLGSEFELDDNVLLENVFKYLVLNQRPQTAASENKKSAKIDNTNSKNNNVKQRQTKKQTNIPQNKKKLTRIKSSEFYIGKVIDTNNELIVSEFLEIINTTKIFEF